jgi:prepilin-type N-terminal cleavage/methylation domain-containing protein
MRRRQQGFTLIEILVVIAIIATLVAAVSVTVPLVQERNRRLGCQRNLKELGTLFLTYQQEKQGKPRYDGASMFLYFRVSKSDVQKGQETVFTCPGDQSVTPPTTPELQAKYDEIDLTNPPADVCSYAVRDFTNYPMSMDSKELEIIACDKQGNDGRTAHHQDGLVILYKDGSSKFMDRDSLGLSAEAPIVVGPGSEHDLLKKVIYAPDRKE